MARVQRKSALKKMFNRVKCNLTLVNDQKQVAQFVWRGISVRVYQYFGGVPAAFFSVCVICMWGFSMASSCGSSGHYVCAFACPCGSAWLSLWCVGVRVLSSVSPPSSLYSEESGPLLYSFSIELTVQCDGCLIWGLV